MRYFVYAPDGQRYGPADLLTLQQWASEGRLLPTSMLEEEASGQRFAASALPGLTFSGATPQAQAPSSPWGQPQSPYQTPTQTPTSNYYRPGMPLGQQQPGYGLTPVGSGDYTTSLVLGIIGAVVMVLCGCMGPIVSVILSSIGLVFANKAKGAGHPQASTCYWLNLIVLILSALGLIGVAVFFGAMGSAGF